jgi:peptide/nickel transport system substrate-binding protein
MLGVAALLALPATAPAAAAASATASASRAERLRIPFPRDDGTLTPYTFEIAQPLVNLIYDTLTVPAGEGLAREITRSRAGRRVTIRLYDRARWHDGRPLTARDVVFTLDYVKRHFHPRYTPQLEAVMGAEAIGKLTVAVTLRHPSPGFNELPLSDLPILPEHLWSRLPSGTLAPPGLAVGSGPYRLVEHRRGERYVLRANRRYFLGRPRVDRIDVSFIDSFDATVRALRNRQVDMIPATLPERTQDDLRESVFETKFGRYYPGTVLMFNVREPPFDDRDARRAVAYALDLQRMARHELIGGRDTEPAVRGYLHPASGWAAAGAVHRFDPARARRELARLRLPAIRILAPNNDPVRLEAGRQVVLALERVGARAVLQEVSAQQLGAAVGESSPHRDFQAAIWSSPALASRDPDFLRVVFGSGQAPLNYSGYRSREFDRLAAVTASATNPDVRRQTVRKQLGLLTDDAPVVPLFFQEGAFVFRPQIYSGWRYVQGIGILDKASFLPRRSRPVGGPADADPIVSPRGAGGGLGAFGYVALGLLAVVVLFIVAGYAARLRRR